MNSYQQEKMMLLQQYRLKLEFTLDIQDMNEMLVRRRLKHIPNYEEVKNDEGLKKLVEHQRKLLEALLSNKAVLKKYINRLLIDMFEAEGTILLKENLGDIDGNEQSILQPIIEGLDDEDRRFFREVIEEGIFSENTPEFQECFQFNLTNAKVEKIVDNSQ
jgi:hypothetical protein